MVVVSFHRLRDRSPEAGAASLLLVRGLAAVVLVCTRAIEGVVKVLVRSDALSAPTMTWTGNSYRRYGAARDDGDYNGGGRRMRPLDPAQPAQRTGWPDAPRGTAAQAGNPGAGLTGP